MITVVCPKCKKENTMCVCMSNAECYVPILGIQDDGTIEYGCTDINEGDNVAYECSECGYRLRVKPDAFDDKFVAWAKKQQQKREKK